MRRRHWRLHLNAFGTVALEPPNHISGYGTEIYIATRNAETV